MQTSFTLTPYLDYPILAIERSLPIDIINVSLPLGRNVHVDSGPTVVVDGRDRIAVGRVHLSSTDHYSFFCNLQLPHSLLLWRIDADSLDHLQRAVIYLLDGRAVPLPEWGRGPRLPELER